MLDWDDFGALGLALVIGLYVIFLEVYGRVCSRRFAVSQVQR